MTPTVDRLMDIALRSSGFISRIDSAMHSIRSGHAPAHRALEHLATDLCSKYALTAEIHGTAIVLYPLNTRAKQPPCIVASMAASQAISGNSVGCYRSAFSVVQVFEAGADDSDDVEGTGAATARRIETKGRTLLV
jgi:hypothetical protein